MSTVESSTSNGESLNDSRPVLTQMGERAAEQSPGWGIPRLGMTQVLLQHQEDARIRAWNSHRAECIALGLTDPGECKPMGDFHIKGDEGHVHHHYAATAPVTTAPTTTPGTSTTSTTLIDRGRGRFRNMIGSVLLGAGLLGGGAAGMAIYNYVTDKPDNVTNITPVGDDEELRVGIHLDN